MELSELDLVADRMRRTLLEVVGEELYSPEWLRQRVLWHVQHGHVFVAELEGTVAGHTIVRVEEGVGVFSTTYVSPEHRRRGVAAGLLGRGEAWMRERGVAQAITYTAEDNGPLQTLYQRRGYEMSRMPDRFVRLSRML